MARPKCTYTRSDETYEVLRYFVPQIAKEYPCNASHIYAIKDGGANDPYPPFRHIFSVSSAAGAPVDIYLRDLQGIVDRRRRMQTDTMADLAARLAESIKADANEHSEIVDALNSGDLDRAECHKILDAYKISDRIDEEIKTLIRGRLAELNDGPKAVT